MGDEFPSFERRFEQLAKEVRALSARVDELSLRLAGPSGTSEHHDSLDGPPAEGVFAHSGQADWTGATVLAGTAAVCFLLVVALTLRTLVDSRIIDQPIGAVAGLLYASLILIYGYYRARTKRRFASLSAACGVTLVLAIVLETHFRFELLPAEAAYAILATTLCVMLMAGLRYHAYGPLHIAVPGISCVAMSMNFPDPDFVYLGCVIVVAIVAAFAVTSDPRTRWLVWCMLALSGFFWMWWTMKLRIPLSRHEQLNPSVWEAWFLPGLVLFAVLYSCQSVYAALRTTRTIGVFECAAPGLAAVGAFIAARAIVVAEGNAPAAVGWAGFGGSLLYAALTVWFARGETKTRRAATWFAMASLLLLVFGVPEIVPHNAVAVVVWAIAAVGVSHFGRGRLEPVVQVGAILLQVYGCIYAAWHGVFRVSDALPVPEVVTTAGLCGVCIFHYVSIQRGTGETDKQQAALPQSIRRTAIAVFLVGVIYAFAAGRIGLFTVLANTMSDVGNYFECGQSILINTGALVLAMVALRRMRKDLLATAVVVAIAGAMKVFAYDLLRTQGIPLVLSVFVFAITTTAGSLIWNRWQRLEEPDESDTTQSPGTVE